MDLKMEDFVIKEKQGTTVKDLNNIGALKKG
jgi:hypothetical protein